MKQSSSNIPKLRFPEFSGEWEQKRLKELVDNMSSGVSVNSLNRPRKNNEHGILKTSAVYQRKFYPEENKTILEAELTRARLNPRKNSIIVSRMNTPDLVGESAYIEKDYESLYIPDRLWQIIIKEEKTNSKLLSFILSYGKVRNILYSLATGTSNSMKNISQPSFLSVKLKLPSILEQKKIASFLSSVEEWIENLKKQKENFEKYKKGMMQKIFSKEIRFKDDDGKKFPEWEEKKAGDIFENCTNKNHKGDLPLLAVTQEKGVVFRDDLDLKINSSELGIKGYKIIEPGNFVISLRSFQGGIEYSKIRGISSPAYTVLKSAIPISDYFFKTYFKREDFIQQLNSMIYGIRDGKQISYSEFKTMKVPYPNSVEQQKIADFLISIDNVINSKQLQITQAEEFKKGLMQRMFI